MFTADDVYLLNVGIPLIALIPSWLGMIFGKTKEVRRQMSATSAVFLIMSACFLYHLNTYADYVITPQPGDNPLPEDSIEVTIKPNT